MDDMTIGQGETIRQTITVEETGAVSAQFVAVDGANSITSDVVSFDGLTADVTVTDTNKPVGSYDYYYKIIWDDDSVDYLPDFSECDGDCEYPQLVVCEVPEVS